MPGFLESVNIAIDGTTSWEIDQDRQLPHVVDVSISFKPIYDTLPKRNMDLNKITPIIGGKNFYNQQYLRDIIDTIEIPGSLNPTNRNDINSNQA